MQDFIDNLCAKDWVWICIVEKFAKFEELLLVFHEPTYVGHFHGNGFSYSLNVAEFPFYVMFNIFWFHKACVQSESYRWYLHIFIFWPVNGLYFSCRLCLNKRIIVECFCDSCWGRRNHPLEERWLMNYVRDREAWIQFAYLHQCVSLFNVIDVSLKDTAVLCLAMIISILSLT